jgi:hypothetical protein
MSGTEVQPEPEYEPFTFEMVPAEEYIQTSEVVSNAQIIANSLALDFLRQGNYNASTGPINLAPGPSRIFAIASDADAAESSPRLPPVGFAELQVQSVGFEEGKDDPAVHLYLIRASVKQIKVLPKEIAGIRLITHKMGPINVRPDSAAATTNRGNLYERNGLICCGSSCAPTSENCAGTLGALVSRPGAEGIYLLSNNHVFAGCNHVPRNQPILSPSSMDGRPDIRAPTEIGRHDMILPLSSGSPNFVNPCENDLALARATDHAAISSWQGNSIDGYDTPTSTASPMSLMRVKKFGRTTGLTFGEVEAKVTTPTPITYNAKHFKGVVWFRDIWTIRARGDSPFALGGDSGSLVVTDDGAAAVGIVFAANSTGEFAWIIPMSSVEMAFGGLRLVGGHGV